MTINSIYERFQIPPNLQRHMQEVATVCLFILDHWTGVTVDQKLTIPSALLHDLGNIVKFKRPFTGELEAEAEHWQTVQDEMILNYGPDAKSATHQMIVEVGLEDSIGKVLRDMDRLVEGVEQMMPEAQIVEFADLCVSPAGIVGYERRKQDLISRYGATHGLDWVAPAEELYKTIQRTVAVDLATLQTNDFSKFQPRIDELVNQEV